MVTLLPFNDVFPICDASAFLAPSATLIGEVTIGAHASVFFGTVVRADRAAIVLGERSNLQDNVTVHGDPGSPTIVGAGVSVGHGAILHGCTVEDDCLIGMGSTVLGGAVVGAGSLVAAGAVVLENTIIPPRSLVAGVPARVRRALSDDEVEALRDNARTYLGLSETYRTMLG
jgi:carbonic anhydrase/acetyltransferase-like protein (isoleucine patch superfamily)